MSIATRFASLLSVAAVTVAIWFGCQGAVSGLEPARAAQSRQAERNEIPSLRALFLAGRFEQARKACRMRVRAGGDGAPAAQRSLHFLEAVVWGQFDAAVDGLRALREKDEDFDSAARAARLLAIRGEREQSLRLALDAVASAAEGIEKVELLETVLAGAPPGDAADRVCEVLLELDPWSAVARSARFRGSVLRDDFGAARAEWRALHFADLFGDELYATDAAGVESLFEAAAVAPEGRWRLGRALADRRRWREARHCLRDATDPASIGCRNRAETFDTFTRELDRVWSTALLAGLADGKAKQVVTSSLPRLCSLLGAATTKDLYATLRDEYGMYLVLLSGDPTSIHSEASEIVRDDEQVAPDALKVGRVRRIVTGAPTFRMAWALAPLTLGTGSKDAYRSDWPDSIVLHASYSIAQAVEAYAVSIGARRDPAAHLPPMADPDAAPGHVASAFMVGNQGNRCFERMRAAIAKELADLPALQPVGSDAWRNAFIGSLARIDLQAAALHEMRHVGDHRDGVLDRPGRELHAFLTELEFAPAAARWLRLGIVATGGNPTASGDPYEAANLDLLVGLLRTLLVDEQFAPRIDRARNLQAQLHLLEPDEIPELARRVAAARAKPPK